MLTIVGRHFIVIFMLNTKVSLCCNPGDVISIGHVLVYHKKMANYNNRMIKSISIVMGLNESLDMSE